MKSPTEPLITELVILHSVALGSGSNLMRTALPLLVAAAAWSSVAFADPTPEAVHLYAAGDFIAAANLAASQHSPADLTFVSQALLAACATERLEQIAREERAREVRRQAFPTDVTSDAPPAQPRF